MKLRQTNRATPTSRGTNRPHAPADAETPPGRHATPDFARFAAVALVLAGVTVAAFWPVTHAEFLNYDDHDYVFENHRVLSGLRAPNIAWAFTTTLTSNWHPLTWLSHMLDCEWFGARPGAHHAMNLAFHTANAVLLFLALLRLTASERLAAREPASTRPAADARVRFWSCAFVAALFALHPLHVESVAWVSERKDVLSGLFFCLTLLAYAQYAQRRLQVENPESGSRNAASSRAAAGRLHYWLALLWFALGLMSKPMLVTLPFLLLLLDYWPLRRWSLPVSGRALWPLVREKLPFVALTAVSCVVTYWAQRAGGAVQPLEAMPLRARIENAFVAYARYLGKTLWPVDLANPYPHPGQWPLTTVLASATLVVVLCWAAFKWGGRRRHLWTGWFWFFGMLVPVIGLVQVGAQSMADRYTYLPLIGLFLALVWSAGEAALRHRALQTALPILGLLVLVACACRTFDQARLWRNSGTLFSHAAAVTRHNDIAWANLGNYYIETGRLDEAIAALQRALECARVSEPSAPSVRLPAGSDGAWPAGGEALFRVEPRRMVACAEVLNNLGTALSRTGRSNAALQCFEAALELKPEHPFALHNLASELAARNRHAEALPLFERAVRARPEHPELRTALGNALMQVGRVDAAIAQYREALRLAPTDAAAHHALGLALAEQGRTEEAIRHFEAALRANPNLLEAHNSLGSALLRVGRLEEAIREFETLLERMPAHHRAHDNLGVALASAGRLAEAAAHLREAAWLEPNNAGTHLNLGNVLAMQGDLAGAVREFNEAVRLAPDLAQAHAHLGSALAELGRREEAIRHLREALRLEPDYAAAREQLRRLGVPADEP